MSSENIKLIIIYNHQYDRNIEKINRIYQDRFKCIIHLMPFYEGGADNVYPCYESSYCFQGFIAQQQEHIIENNVDYYVFLADDCILNPSINDDNITDLFQLKRNDAFIRNIENLNPRNGMIKIPNTNLYITKSGIKNGTDLDSNDHFLYLGRARNRLKNTREFKIEDYIPNKLRRSQKYRKFGLNVVKYSSLLLGWSDLCIVPKSSIQAFCRYCGVLAAANVHVELAIPTALVWSMAETGQIVNETKLNSAGYYGNQNHVDANVKCIKDIEKLFQDSKCLYVHPIKISKCRIMEEEE